MLDKDSFFMQFLRLAGPYWNSEEKFIIRRDSLLLVVLTVFQMLLAVVVTEWNAALFDALENHSVSGVMKQVGVLTLIFTASIFITTMHLLVKRRILIGWRLWLTKLVSAKWLNNGRHYQLTFMGKNNHDNPDGRIAEDIRIATEEAIALAHSLFYSLLLLLSFTKILWTISGHFTLNLGVGSIDIYGYLVWIAIVYAIIASFLGWWTGKPLTSSTDERQTEEANYRHDLIITQENSQAIALLDAEDLEQERLLLSFQGIIRTYALQTEAWKQIQMFQSGYSVVSMAVPILVAAPRYLVNAITLGTLMQSVQAFQQMTGALSWPVNNLPQIAKWRTSVERVLGLVKALDELDYDIASGIENQLCMDIIDERIIKLENVRIGDRNGTNKSELINFAIKLGDRLVLSGRISMGGKLFQAIAGLWPWGEGHIYLPKEDHLFFMPPKPYMPKHTLMNSTCHPKSSLDFGQTEIETALKKAKLAELIPILNTVDTWNELLSREQLQRLGVVRVLLSCPKWIFIQEALDSLSVQDQAEMLALLSNEFPNAAIICLTNQILPDSLNYHSVTI